MEHIEIYATAIATILIVVGIAWNMARAVNYEMKTIWKRFDQYKEHLESTHVSKEVCGILHKQICEDVVEIKADVKKLLLLYKNGKGNGSS